MRRFLFLMCSIALWPDPSFAMTCPTWDRMDTRQKSANIDRMIQGAIAGSRGRQYHVDRAAVGRCLANNAQAIEYDFDGACADARTAGKQTLNRIFKNYIWTCAG